LQNVLFPEGLIVNGRIRIVIAQAHRHFIALYDLRKLTTRDTEVGSASAAVPKVIATMAAKKILVRSIKYLVLAFSFVRRNIPLQERAPYRPRNDDSYRMTFQTVFWTSIRRRYE
jgi:hypothetical protein